MNFKRVEHIFQKIDIFGRRVEVMIDKRKIHKTNFGAIVTLLIAILVIAFGFIDALEAIDKSKPTVIEQVNLIYLKLKNS